ncbi:MAG: hypothetical protein AAB791_01700, partial [Patescibacteria group bacterium]
IKKNLLGVGWKEAEINTAFGPASTPVNHASSVGNLSEIESTARVGRWTVFAAIIIILLLVSGGLWFGFSFIRTTAEKVKVVDKEPYTNSQLEEVNVNPAGIEQNLPGENNIANNEGVAGQQATTASDLWSLFDRFNEALKNQDIAAINDISYKEIPPEMASQFGEFATYFYNENIKLNKADFVNIWQDDKQAIFSTNPIKDAKSGNYEQKRVSFVKSDGLWKLLTVGSKVGGLVFMTPDSDKDGLSDQEETCSGASQYDPNCVKTDPNNRDTNNNGWWDGIDSDIKKDAN